MAMAGSNLTIFCRIVAEGTVECNGTNYYLPEEPLSYRDTWFWLFLAIYVALVLFAGLMSGLTLGMLSLDMMTLKILQEAGTPAEKKHAARIYPVVERHHLLLVTLLLANAVAVESMPLCLDRVSDPITAIVVSVSAVLLFGEVFPQALCSRYGLAIGATLVPLVYVLMGLFFIISWPLSKFLDCLLGQEHATFFRRAELKALVGLHGPDEPEDGESSEGRLTLDEVLIIKGALEMRDKTARDAMVPIESVFMLEVNTLMDRDTMKMVLSAAHSRVPIYEKGRENILGVLLVKTLIMLDPEVRVPITSLVHNPCCLKQATYVEESLPLFDVLNEFQTGKSHLSFVYRLVHPEEATSQDVTLAHPDILPVTKEIVGVITLEDIIEELLQEEIIDETDVYVDVHKRVRVARARARMMRSNSGPSSGRTTPAQTPRNRRKAHLKIPGRPLPPATEGQNGEGQTTLNVPDTTATDSELSDNPSTPLLS